jgi:hypothetical protein
VVNEFQNFILGLGKSGQLSIRMVEMNLKLSQNFDLKKRPSTQGAGFGKVPVPCIEFNGLQGALAMLLSKV